MTDLERLAIAAIRASPFPYDRAAPVADSVVRFKRAGIRAFRERVERGGDDDPLYATALLSPPDRFSRVARRQLGKVDDSGDHSETSSLEFIGVFELLKLLRVGGVVGDDCLQQAIEATQHPLEPPALQRTRVFGFLAEHDVEAAEREAESPHLDGRNWTAWRAIGEYRAEHGDEDKFLTLWPKFDARQKKEWIERMRQSAVEGVSRHHGWQAGVRLARHRRIKTRSNADLMLKTALQPLTETMSARELDTLVRDAPELTDLPEMWRLLLLVDAMLAHPHEEIPQTDHLDLASVLDRIIAVDPTESKEQSRLRDYALSKTWPLIGQEETLRRMRSAIRAPKLRNEFDRLRRDAVTGS